MRNSTVLSASPTVPCLCFPAWRLQALLAGLGELLSWVGYVGAEVAVAPADAEKAIDRVSQAARYLVQVSGWVGAPGGSGCGCHELGF